MRRLKYIGYYAIPEKCKKYRCALSAVNKMSYICEAIAENGYHVDIISAASSVEPERSTVTALDETTDVRLFLSIGTGNKLKRILGYAIHVSAFFWYLMKNIKKDDQAVVYHSLQYMPLISLLKRLKKFRLVLEVEEIYSDVSGNMKTKIKEERFFKLADAFIFPTEMLDSKINIHGKPSAIVYGTYHSEEKRSPALLYPMDPTKKHLLYAGTFDPRKGGAEAAVSVTEFLSDEYHVHIIGFGSERDTRNLQEKISKVTALGGAQVTMDGLFSGEDYIKFVQSCDVGLSTQSPKGSYNDTSFPSKVLSYMANGLRVVSVRIPVLERSKVSDTLYYYDGDDPQRIAQAIKGINWDEIYDSSTVLAKLHENFVKDIDRILKG